MDGLGPGFWVAFAALMLSVVGGGVGIAAFIVSQIGDLGTRLAVVESKLDTVLGGDGANSGFVSRRGGRRGGRGMEAHN